MFWVKHADELDRDGVFYGELDTFDDRKYAILWGLLNWIIEIHSPVASPCQEAELPYLEQSEVRSDVWKCLLQLTNAR